MKPTTRVALFGGLGNQLFQYAFFQYLRILGVNAELVYEEINIRKTNAGNPDLCELVPEKMGVINPYNPGGLLARKLLNLSLRLTSPRNSFQALIYKTAQIAIERATRIVPFDKRHISGSTNPGYSEMQNLIPSTFFIGYFQTFRWASIPQVNNELQKLGITKRSNLVEEYYLRSRSSIPLVVHIRIGDYLLNPRIGVLSSEYYNNAIKKMWSSEGYGEVWIFSDSPELAREKIGSLSDIPFLWVNPVNASPSEILEIMRLGSGYVLSNSTFGWWGAFLSRNHNPKVIAPHKWFKDISDPIDICPETWERMDSKFEMTVK